MQFSDCSFFPSTLILAYCKPNTNTDSAQEAYEQVTERRSQGQIPWDRALASSILNGILLTMGCRGVGG